MASNRKVMVLPGDGIGVEVMAANLKLIDWFASINHLLSISARIKLAVLHMMRMEHRLKRHLLMR